jgi:putative oxidoreductase
VTKTIVTWILTVVPSLLFVVSGGAKLAGLETEGFRGEGFPDGFVYLVGAIELFGALGFLYPRLATWAAVPLVGVMIGATATHAVHGQYGLALVPAAVGVMVGVVGWLRRGRMLVPAAGGAESVARA